MIPRALRALNNLPQPMSMILVN